MSRLGKSRVPTGWKRPQLVSTTTIQCISYTEDDISAFLFPFVRYSLKQTFKTYPVSTQKKKYIYQIREEL